MLDVILLERVENLGQMGQVVKVRPGYARNYLLPQKKAMRATKENLAYFDTQRAQLEATNLQRKSEAIVVAEKAEGLTVVLIRQAGESGQLYGSVTARDVGDALKEQGFTVDRALIYAIVQRFGLSDQAQIHLASINGDRLLIQIRSVRDGRNLYTTDLQVYDLDGMPGVHIPDVLDQDVAKQSATESVSGLNILTTDPGLGAEAANAG